MKQKMFYYVVKSIFLVLLATSTLYAQIGNLTKA
jgi:hypothetical protein